MTIHDLESFRIFRQNRPTVVTVGNFDGCHLGHQKLLSQAVTKARQQGMLSTALTFSPHPDCYFGRLTKNDMLYTEAQKFDAFRAAGIDEVIVHPFREEFANISPEKFLDWGLIECIGAKAVIVGKNFRFGKAGAGTTKTMEDYFSNRGIDVIVSEMAATQGEAISSSRIRRDIKAGDVDLAAQQLGHDYAVLGRVVQGQKLGRTIGIPTANLGQVEQMLPKKGVYAVRVRLERSEGSKAATVHATPPLWQGVANIGVRPTVTATGQLSIEAHVFHQPQASESGEWYGRVMEIQFVARIRDEKKFPSLETLKAQIAQDIESARSILI